ncbi:MAG TPA: hypothetical protein VF543_05910 [Pyrinomonadaceae bacterium]|jgi:calcineurin-like phosphoesterase family protein
MKLSFFPGDLHLTKTQDGSYVITIKGEEVFNGRNEKKAIAEFNKIRKDMETLYPARELSVEEKTAALMRYIGQSLGVPKESKKPGRKYTPGSTNTFG